MPAPHDLDPDAMTENERLEKRRYQAYFAFETQPRQEHFDQGATEHLAPPTGRARDPQSGKEANYKGRTASGDPMYRVPGTKKEDQWTQLHPNPAKR